MASVTIDKRQKANGEYSYRCTVRVKKNGVIIHRESKTFSKKVESKTLMLDFLDVPQDRAVRKRPGAYDSYLFGNGNQKVKVVLLDTRSFQDVLERNKSGTSRYKSNQGDILGAAQWTWLEAELSKNDAAVVLIVSSIQVVAKDHGFEKWDNFPRSRQRLLDLVSHSSQKNIVFLSGDRHIAEVSKMDLANVNYPLYDITSSGMTHSYEKADEYNQFRVSKLIGLKNYGVLNFKWSEGSVDIGLKIKGNSGQDLIDYNLGLFSY